MLEILGRKNSSNVIPVMWAIAELKLEHVRRNVGGTFGGLDSDEYGAINPNRLVPTMNDNGFILWESNTIIRYLCRQYGAGSLYPEDPQQCALADQWMEWFKSTVMPSLYPAFWGLVRTPEEEQNHEQIHASARLTGEKLKILDHHLAGRSFILGDDFTMADIPLGAILYRYSHLDMERPSLPNIEAWYNRLQQRDAYRTHVMIPFGSSLKEWLELEKAGA